MIRDDCVLCDKNSHTMKKTNIITFAKKKTTKSIQHIHLTSIYTHTHCLKPTKERVAHFSPFHFTHASIFYSGADIDIYDESNRIEPKSTVPKLNHGSRE